MKAQSSTIFRRTGSILWVVVFLLMASVAQSATHVIQFGGSLGFVYVPNSMTVSVGDTIQWVGDFSMHPLSSTSVPASAVSFHQGAGSVFSYRVTVAGTYLYQCDYHFSIGMTGSFTANLTGVEDMQTSVQPSNFKLMQNFPNPFNPTTMISFDIPYRTYVSIKVFNLIGQEVATIVSEMMDAGSYSRIWNAASLPSGVYFYRLQTESFNAIKRLILIK